jgi:positive regulator of sigma E activity
MNQADDDTLLVRQARVVAVDAGQVVVRLERVAACSACPGAKLCGAGSRSQDFSVPHSAPEPIAPGDQVMIGIAPTAALRATAVAYLTPLAGLITAMALASACGFADGAVAVFSLVGLGLGFIAMRHLARHPSQRIAPVLFTADTPVHCNPHSENKP